MFCLKGWDGGHDISLLLGALGKEAYIESASQNIRFFLHILTSEKERLEKERKKSKDLT